MGKIMGSLRSKLLFAGLTCLVLLAAAVSDVNALGGGKIKERIKERIQQRRESRQEHKETTSAEAPYQIIEGEGTSYKESPYEAGDYRRYLEYAGRKRFYDLHVPARYTKSAATPLVLNLHGGGGKPMQQRRDSGMDAVSDTGGFIVAYPAGTGKKEDQSLTWNSGIGDNYANQNNIDDVGFIRALLNDVEKLFHIDQKRIYATGFSNGGFMCYRLAAELSDTIAAIAPVSGVMGTGYAKKQTRPISVIHFHGLKDTFVPYNGGSGRGTLKNADLPSVEETINYWISFNGCSKEPQQATREGNALRRYYGNGKDKTEVILWILEDGGHTWPGGESTLPQLMVGKVNTDINASQLIWEFFKRHPMP